MSEKNNASCSICGKGYYKCLSCQSFKDLYPWKIYTDTSEHFKIYQILHGYSTGIYEKSEAKEKLQNVDLSDLESFRDIIKTTIKEIMNDDKDIKDRLSDKADDVKDTTEKEMVSYNFAKNNKTTGKFKKR